MLAAKSLDQPPLKASEVGPTREACTRVESRDVVYGFLIGERVVRMEKQPSRDPSEDPRKVRLEEIITMTAVPKPIDLSTFVSEHMERAEPDLLRSMLQTFVQARR
jgi:non-ribosomal peptide synthetase component F